VSKTKSELVNAATELDDELTRFEDGVGAFKKLSLTSKKAIDRAAKMLEELAASEQAMGSQIQALVAAISSTREKQLERVTVIREKAAELTARSLELRDLMIQFEALGTGAAELNAKLQAQSPAVVVDVANEVSALGAKAEALVAIAREKNFDDVVHMADGLRQQLTSLAGKLSKAAGPAS
jgi:chromosome segregation ATPase